MPVMWYMPFVLIRTLLVHVKWADSVFLTAFDKFRFINRHWRVGSWHGHAPWKAGTPGAPRNAPKACCATKPIGSLAFCHKHHPSYHAWCRESGPIRTPTLYVTWLLISTRYTSTSPKPEIDFRIFDNSCWQYHEIMPSSRALSLSFFPMSQSINHLCFETDLVINCACFPQEIRLRPASLLGVQTRALWCRWAFFLKPKNSTAQQTLRGFICSPGLQICRLWLQFELF